MKKELDTLITEFYTKDSEKVGFSQICQIIEEILDDPALDKIISEAQEKSLAERKFTPKGAKARERILRLPNVVPTEISVGQRPDSEDRAQFELWMQNIGMDSGTDSSAVAQKLKAITQFFDSPEANLRDATIAQTLSYLMFLNQFVWMLKEFNASVAGFLWEPFLASLFGGKSRQVPTSEGDIADIRIDTGEGDAPISLKILNKSGAVKGSFTDLVDHFSKDSSWGSGPAEMRYIVVVKTQSSEQKTVSAAVFWEFNINADSFFDWIGNVHYLETVESVQTSFSLQDADKKPWLKTGSNAKPGAEGNYVWIRHATPGKLGGRSPQPARASWLRLAQIIDKGVRPMPKPADAFEQINLQGDIADPSAKLSAEISAYKAGGKAGGKTPGAKVRASYKKTGGTEDDMFGAGTKDTDALWGGAEQLNAWSVLAQKLREQLGDLDGGKRFFKAVAGDFSGIESAAAELGLSGNAPGYSTGASAIETDEEVLSEGDEGSGGKQFHIKPAHYTRLGTNLGTLKITPGAVEDFFTLSAQQLNEDLITMFNALADLTDNIGRFFLTDCSGGTGEDTACSPADEAARNTAGGQAIRDARVLEDAVSASVKGMTDK